MALHWKSQEADKLLWTLTALMTNAHAHAELLLLHSLEQAVCDIDLHVNTDKMEYMCFNQSGDISTLNGGFLKLGDKFTYLRSSVSSTENDISMQLVKAWTAIDRLLVIWKSDLSNKIKRNFFFFFFFFFFQVAVMFILLYGCTTWTLTMCMVGEKAWQQLYKDATSYIKQILVATSHKTAAVWSPTTHLEDHSN